MDSIYIFDAELANILKIFFMTDAMTVTSKENIPGVNRS